MGVLEEDEAVYVVKKESSFTIRMYSRVGKSILLYCTAIGKILLSGMDEKELSAYPRSGDAQTVHPQYHQGPPTTGRGA